MVWEKWDGRVIMAVSTTVVAFTPLMGIARDHGKIHRRHATGGDRHFNRVPWRGADHTPGASLSRFVPNGFRLYLARPGDSESRRSSGAFYSTDIPARR